MRPRLAAVGALAALLLTGCTSAPEPVETPAAPTLVEVIADAAPDWEGMVTTPVAPEVYYETLMADVESGDTVKLDGIRAEYEAAASTFPFPLPDGWSFPADPGYVDNYDGPNWNRELNLNRVWQFWEFANTTAAQAAWEAGDEVAALGYLDVIRDGYLSPVFPTNWVDTAPEDWYDWTYGAARQGDFSEVWSFVHNPLPYEP